MQQAQRDYEIVRLAMRVFKDPQRLKRVKRIAAQKEGEQAANKITLGGKHDL